MVKRTICPPSYQHIGCEATRKLGYTINGVQTGNINGILLKYSLFDFQSEKRMTTNKKKIGTHYYKNVNVKNKNRNKKKDKSDGKGKGNDSRKKKVKQNRSPKNRN